MLQGFVYRDISNVLCSKVISVFDDTEAPPPAADIIFLARCEHKAKLEASLDAVCQFAQQIEGDGKLLTLPHTANMAFTAPDEYYVYAYTGKPETELQRWTDCFYIGKGKKKRWTDHVKDRAKNAAKGIPPKGAKQLGIQSWINRFPELNSQKLVGKASGSLVRKVAAWRGDYAEAQSFAVEYFLIAHHLGPHTISNETGGNMKNGNIYALARPAIFDKDSAIHKTYWEGTVAEFCKFPQTQNDRSLWKPALLLLHAEKMIDELDAQLAILSITPHDMSNNGRLKSDMMLRPHCQVDGAGDATINYSMPSQNAYRLQLKLSATRNEVRINMRPQKSGVEASKEFQKYLDTLVLDDRESFGCQICNGHLQSIYGQHKAIKDPNKDPFFKPFAQNAVGNVSPYFDIANLDERSKTSTTNWIEGEISLNLIEAMRLIFDVFWNPEAKRVIPPEIKGLQK